MMLRLDEIGLFLVPFALFVLWRVMGPRTPPAAVWAASALVVLLVAGLFWFGLDERAGPNTAYAPAKLEGGVIIPGHAVPRP